MMTTYIDSLASAQAHISSQVALEKRENREGIPKIMNLFYKSVGKKILNTTFYPDQKGINKFIKDKFELKGNKQVKTKNFKSENAKIKKVVRPMFGLNQTTIFFCETAALLSNDIV